MKTNASDFRLGDFRFSNATNPRARFSWAMPFAIHSKIEIRESKIPKAFTLLEVLVALAILALMVVALASMASEASRMWSSAEAKNQRRSTGRALLQFMARDLEMAVVPNLYPSTNPANLQFVASLPTVMPAAVLNPHAAFWQAPIAANRSRGDLAQIGYFVRWDTTSQPGTAKAQLCRFFVDPAETTNYQIYSREADDTPTDWLTASTLDQVAPATEAGEYRGWFADNVIALWILCIDSQDRPILKTAAGVTLNGGYGFDSRQGYENPSAGREQLPSALPASVEISLVTVDSRTARRIQAPISAAPGSPANFHKDQNTPGSLAHFIANLPTEIRAGVQVFSTRVYLKNAPPASGS